LNATVPVTVLTGADDAFLADAAPALARFALVRHEDAADDGEDGPAVGCVCCRLRGGLTLSLLELLRRASRGEAPAFARVVILAAPGDAAAVLREFAVSPALVTAFRVDALVAVMDNAATRREDALIADRVMVAGHDAPRGDAWLLRAERSAATRVAPASVRAADDDSLERFALAWDEPQALPQIGDWLHQVAQVHGERLLRATGVVAAQDAARAVALHVLGHIVAPPSYLDHGTRESRVAFTVRGLEPGDLLPPWPVAVERSVPAHAG